jgi:hypothetical protein
MLFWVDITHQWNLGVGETMPNYSPSVDVYVQVSDDMGSYPTDNNDLVVDNWEYYTGVIKNVLLKFDLTTIPVGSIINSATLNLYQYNHGFNNGPVPSIECHKHNNPDDITNTSAPSVALDYDSTVLGSYSNWQTNGWKTFIVTSAISGSTVGFAVINSVPNPYGFGNAVFRSQNYTTDVTKRPYLAVDYTEPATGRRRVIIINPI